MILISFISNAGHIVLYAGQHLNINFLFFIK